MFQIGPGAPASIDGLPINRYGRAERPAANCRRHHHDRRTDRAANEAGDKSSFINWLVINARSSRRWYSCRRCACSCSQVLAMKQSDRFLHPFVTPCKKCRASVVRRRYRFHCGRADHGDCQRLRVLRSRVCVSARLKFHTRLSKVQIDPRREC